MDITFQAFKSSRLSALLQQPHQLELPLKSWASKTSKKSQRLQESEKWEDHGVKQCLSKDRENETERETLRRKNIGFYLDSLEVHRAKTLEKEMESQAK